MPPSPASLPLTLLLGFLIALVALGIDSTVPGLPAVASAFGADPGAAQVTLTGLFAGIACGQLVWGPLSDRFGRRGSLLAGLALLAGASVWATGATTLAGLAGIRFLQGCGLACGPVLGRSIVRDLYTHDEAARLLSRMMIVFGLVPILAPLAGGALLASGGWSAVYWLHLAVAIVLAAVVARFLPETRPAPSVSRPPLAMARRAAALLRQRAFLRPLVVLLGAQLGIIAFVTNSSLTLIRGFGMTPAEYSLAFAAVMLGQVGGAFASSRLVTRFGGRALLRSGAALAAGTALTLAALAWLDVRHWSAVVGPMFVFLIAASLVIPNATAAALAPFPEDAGSASSLMGALAFGVGAALGAALGWAFDGSARPMASAIFACAAVAWFVARRLAPAPPRSHG